MYFLHKYSTITFYNVFLLPRHKNTNFYKRVPIQIHEKRDPPPSTAPGMEQTQGQQGESQDNLCQPRDWDLPYPRVFLPWALQVCLSVKSLGPAGATTGVTHPLEQEVSLEMGLA